MHPVERALHVGQSLRQASYDISVGCDAKADTVDNSIEADVGARQNVDICFHTWMNVVQLRLTEIGHYPPGPRVNEREDFLPGVRISALRNGEVGNAAIEGGNEFAVVEVVLGQIDCGSASGALRSKRF